MIAKTQDLCEYIDTFATLLCHYETSFYENDEGLIAIFDISSTLLVKLNEIPEKLLHVIFQIAINVQATRSIAEVKRKESPLLLSLLAKKTGFTSVA